MDLLVCLSNHFRLSVKEVPVGQGRTKPRHCFNIGVDFLWRDSETGSERLPLEQWLNTV